MISENTKETSATVTRAQKELQILTIDLKVDILDMIDDRVYKKMLAYPDFERGVWIQEDRTLALHFKPEAALGSEDFEKCPELKTEIAKYDVDKEAILVLSEVVTFDTKVEGKARTVMTNAFLVTKPNAGINIRPLPEVIA